MGHVTSYVATGVGNGTYYIRLRTKNACGDLSAASTEITTVVGPTTTGTVTLNSLGLTGCTYKTDPFPGYFNWTATAVVTVTKIVRNGWVSVYFNYGADGGSFYYGFTAVPANAAPGVVTVNLRTDT